MQLTVIGVQLLAYLLAGNVFMLNHVFRSNCSFNNKKSKQINTKFQSFLLTHPTISMSSCFRNARRKMCPEAAEEPSVIKARAGLFWLQKTRTVLDDKVDGDYGLIINGHSLVRRLFQVH